MTNADSVLRHGFDHGTDPALLADIAGEFHVSGQVRAAGGDADAPALLAEGADDMAAEEAGAAENRDDLASHMRI